jgi:thiosulfate dehydrogenase
MQEMSMRSPMLIAMLSLLGCPKASPEETVEVKLCDNHTTTTVSAEAPKTEEFGRAVAATLMEKWQQQNPSVDWEADERASRPFNPPADNKALLADKTQAGDHPYRTYTEQDLLTWSRETEKLAVAGSRVFHSADELGSTIAVSCDMCHPHAANTHPETYPKFQTQIGQVALLRDMINWCLEHPVRAKPMASDDPRMRAMEGYIYAQRKGTPLNYGQR